jgi:hypothetical protein
MASGFEGQRSFAKGGLFWEVILRIAALSALIGDIFMGYGIPKDSGGDSPDNVAQMERCVEAVMKDGKDKISAIRICKSSLFGMEATGLEAVGKMISRKNMQTLCDAHKILGDLITAAQEMDMMRKMPDQMDSARVCFDGERLFFRGNDE